MIVTDTSTTTYISVRFFPTSLLHLIHTYLGRGQHPERIAQVSPNESTSMSEQEQPPGPQIYMSQGDKFSSNEAPKAPS